jgi:hypothetical protein
MKQLQVYIHVSDTEIAKADYILIREEPNHLYSIRIENLYSRISYPIKKEDVLTFSIYWGQDWYAISDLEVYKVVHVCDKEPW